MLVTEDQLPTGRFVPLPQAFHAPACHRAMLLAGVVPIVSNEPPV
jgi:hypothetical protein